jgi:TRAP-type transport system small permease protein
MDRMMGALARLLEYVIAAALAVMVVLVFGNVVMRYAFNSGITVSEEVSRWLFIWVTFLGGVVALRDGAHLGVDMLVARLPAWGRRACLGLTKAMMLTILAMLFKGALDQVKINWDVTAPTTGASMAIVHSAALVFATLAGAILVYDLACLARGKERAPAAADPEVAASPGLHGTIGQPATAEATR